MKLGVWCEQIEVLGADRRRFGPVKRTFYADGAEISEADYLGLLGDEARAMSKTCHAWCPNVGHILPLQRSASPVLVQGTLVDASDYVAQLDSFGSTLNATRHA